MLTQLIQYLQTEDKAGALQFCLDALENKRVDVATLYQTVLGPALNSIDQGRLSEVDLIWREHVWTAIIRGIVESAYPYVMREREAKGLATADTVLVFCPAEEDHDLGARMAADFFLIWGYRVTYIGANTPENTLLQAIRQVKPRLLSISIVNYYNLVVTRKLISRIREAFGSDLQILVGGHAVASRPGAARDLGADRVLQRFEDIGQLRLGGK